VENYLDGGPSTPTSSIYIFQQNHPYSPLDVSDTSSTWTNDYTGSNTDSLGNDYSAAPLNLEAGVHEEDARVFQVIDRVNTTATVWLGTTLACAQ